MQDCTSKVHPRDHLAELLDLTGLHPASLKTLNIFGVIFIHTGNMAAGMAVLLLWSASITLLQSEIYGMNCEALVVLLQTLVIL